MAEQHQVAQGDTLFTIAQQYGFRDWTYIWEHPDNAELRQTRNDPLVLAEGDIVHVPDIRVATFDGDTNEHHEFRLLEPLKMPFSITLRDDDGHLLTGIDYQLTGEGIDIAGRTGDDGMVKAELPPKAESVTLEFVPDPDEPEEKESWEIRFGQLEPVDTPAGRQFRLLALGFDCEVTGQLDEATAAAMESFRETYSLPEVESQILEALDDLFRGA
jgi:hypothetical protein